MEFKHKSVLLDETIDSLNIKPDGIYVDGTLGGGGHSLEICKRLSDKGRLIGIDQDLDAIAAATERLKDYKDRVTIVHSNYQDIDAVEVMDSVIDVFNMIAGLKKITIREEKPEKLPVCADIDMLKTVIRNLLSNAIKFSNDGTF